MKYEEIFDNGYKMLCEERNGANISTGNIINMYSDLLTQKILAPILGKKCTTYKAVLLLCAVEKVRGVLHSFLIQALDKPKFVNIATIAEEGAKKYGFDVKVSKAED